MQGCGAIFPERQGIERISAAGGTVQALQASELHRRIPDFISRYPKNTFVSEARQQIENLDSPLRAGGQRRRIHGV